jgi:hypothetical protein
MSVLSQFFGGGDQIPIEVWAVGGGGAGGGGGAIGGGGGGAGQVLYARTLVPKKIAFTITIGGGGAAGTPVGASGLPGNSSIFSNMVAYGGIGGRGDNPAALSELSFGSGGGGGGTAQATNNTITQSTFTSDGYVLANSGSFGNPTQGGGGGGALKVGNLSPGGDGVPSSLFGISLAVAGGGAGGTAGPPASGGIGGGGSSNSPTAPKNGTANTGGGGAGGPTLATPVAGGTGGSGIVVIRYPTGFAAATVTGNAPTPAQPGYNVYRWDSGPATITFN